MKQKIGNIEKLKIVIVLLLTFISISSIALANPDTVTINVNVSEAAQIEVTPDTATFNQVTPGVDTFPGSLRFTITNVGSTNFTQMYVSVNVPTTETSNPLGTSNPANYRAGGFVVLMNDTMLGSSDDWNFVGRQEWNLTDKPSDYTKDTDVVSWGYFGNNSKQYFWDLRNGTEGYCNQTDARVRVKNWAVNGSAAAYDLSSDATTYTLSGDSQQDWGVFTPDATAGNPLKDYCIAARTDCERFLVYQWRTGNSQLDTCTGYWYLYNDAVDKFKTNDQFYFNITVWVPKGIPAGDTSSSILTVTAT